MSGALTFADRCAIASACLPKADYRAKLEELHAEMLAAIPQAGAEPDVNYFVVQAMAAKWRIDYNTLSAAIRGYLSLAAPTAQPAPLPAREPLTRDAAHALFELWYDDDNSGVEFVRMIERAHGITAAKDKP